MRRLFLGSPAVINVDEVIVNHLPPSIYQLLLMLKPLVAKGEIKIIIKKKNIYIW